MNEVSKRTRSDVSSDSSTSSPLASSPKRLKHLHEQYSPFKPDMQTDKPPTPTKPLTQQTLQVMLDQMKQQIVEDINSKYEKTVELLQSRVYELEIKSDRLETTVKDQAAEITSLRQDLTIANNNALKAKQMAVQNQQHSRKSNVRVYGVKECEEQYEDCVEVVQTLFEEKLGVTLSKEDIDAAHRVGRIDNPNRKGPRAILVKFLRRTHKAVVVKNRRKLKGTRTIIVDDLCKEVYELYNRLENDPRVKSAWTYNGKVFIEDLQGKKHLVQYGELLPNLPISAESD